MKKILILCFFTLSFICFAVKDIPADDKYKGYRKLIEHEFEKKYDLYFKVENNNGTVSEEMKVIPLYPGVNLKEKITIVFPNGEKRVATRENWYKVFRNLDMDYGIGRVLSEEKLYDEWVELERDGDAERILKKYIQEEYYPKIGVEPIRNRFL